MNTPSTTNHDSLLVQPTDGAIPAGIDRRTFLIRNAVIGAAAVMTGTMWLPGPIKLHTKAATIWERARVAGRGGAAPGCVKGDRMIKRRRGYE
jgi:L-serine dehydratase